MKDYNNKNTSFYDKQTIIINLKLEFLSFKLDCDSNNNQNLSPMSLNEISKQKF